MRGWTAEDLRRSTLRRQFPDVPARGPDAVVELIGRLGPIQTQVPRAVFLTVSSRLPGATYEEVCGLFEDFRLLKGTNLRGTVHTSTAEQFARLDAVATQARAGPLKNRLALDADLAGRLDQEVRRFCAEDWRPRRDVVDHARRWLTDSGHPDSAGRLSGSFAESLVWGTSGLVRRPRDRAWDKRTDAFHRTATALVPRLIAVPPEEALVELVRRHLRAYGPVTRRDLAFFFGVGLTQVDRAVRALGNEAVPCSGPDEVYLDLAEPPSGGTEEVGVRLLPEFDGLLLGFAGPGRTRFVTADELEQVWARVNGVFAPVVLHDGRLVATWRTVTAGRRTDLEVRMLGGRRPMAEDLLAAASAATARVLDLSDGDVRVLGAGDR